MTSPPVWRSGLFTLRRGPACATRFSRPDYDTSDVIDLAVGIGGFLIKVPTAEELALVHELLAARQTSPKSRPETEGDTPGYAFRPRSRVTTWAFGAYANGSRRPETSASSTCSSAWW